MGLRTALQRTRWITLAVIAVSIWFVVVWFDTFSAMDFEAVGYIGQAGVSGIVGLIVMAGVVALLVAFLAEVGEEGPSPESWPPE